MFTHAAWSKAPTRASAALGSSSSSSKIDVDPVVVATQTQQIGCYTKRLPAAFSLPGSLLQAAVAIVARLVDVAAAVPLIRDDIGQC